MFKSFWMGGFEGADRVNGGASPLAVRDLTQHAERADEDYARLREFGIRTVRESLSWRLIERNGRCDFSMASTRAAAARSRGLQVIWTLCHGLPGDVEPLSSSFPPRFARYAARAARFLRETTDGAPLYVPISEPTYLAWVLCGGARLRDRTVGAERCMRLLRRQLAQASILACEAILDVDRRARFIHTDPLLRLVPPQGSPELERACADGFEDQFYFWDLVTGSVEPELGGSARCADYLGINYYQSSQADFVSGKALAWQLDDPRRAPLSTLLRTVYERYGRPMLIAETGHRGVRRGRWIREIADEVGEARAAGVPLEGICLYPLIDRPDWDNPSHWHDCGFWDVEQEAGGRLQRHVNWEFAAALREAQRALPGISRPMPQAVADVSAQYSTAPGKSAKISANSRQPRATT